MTEALLSYNELLHNIIQETSFESFDSLAESFIQKWTEDISNEMSIIYTKIALYGHDTTDWR